MSLVLGGLFHLLLQTEAALIGDYSREQIDYRYVLYMTPLQKTRTIPLTIPLETLNGYLGGGAHSVSCFLETGNPVSSRAGGQLCKAVIVLA